MNWFFNKRTINDVTITGADFGSLLLGAVLSVIDEVVVYYDADFTIKIFNKAAERLCGINAKEVIDKQFSLEQARQSSSRVLAYIMFPSLATTVVRQSAEGEYPHIVDVIIDEPPRALQVTLDRIRNTDGAIVGFVKVVRDRTSEKTAALAQHEFITVAAHQLRTPATAVNWALDTIAQTPALSAEAQESVRLGQQAAKNLLKIIEDVLNIAQVEGGDRGYQLQKTDLVEFFDRVLATADPIAREYQVKVYLERPSEPMWALIDAAKLSLAVSNLIDNAVKYNVPNGEVVVSMTVVDDGFIKMAIKDTGVGIPEDEAKNLFQKFFRGSNVSKMKAEGSGLGLYLAKKVVERHGGKIWMESVEGRGTTFFFTLPVVSG